MFFEIERLEEEEQGEREEGFLPLRVSAVNLDKPFGVCSHRAVCRAGQPASTEDRP